MEKDEYCDCPCHAEGVSYDKCPFCYFVDGIPGMNERLDRHQEEYPDKGKPIPYGRWV